MQNKYEKILINLLNYNPDFEGDWCEEFLDKCDEACHAKSFFELIVDSNMHCFELVEDYTAIEHVFAFMQMVAKVDSDDKKSLRKAMLHKIIEDPAYVTSSDFAQVELLHSGNLLNNTLMEDLHQRYDFNCL